jgi:hypothetical protein
VRASRDVIYEVTYGAGWLTGYVQDISIVPVDPPNRHDVSFLLLFPPKKFPRARDALLYR